MTFFGSRSNSSTPVAVLSGSVLPVQTVRSERNSLTVFGCSLKSNWQRLEWY